MIVLRMILGGVLGRVLGNVAAAVTLLGAGATWMLLRSDRKR